MFMVHFKVEKLSDSALFEKLLWQGNSFELLKVIQSIPEQNVADWIFQSITSRNQSYASQIVHHLCANKKG